MRVREQESKRRVGMRQRVEPAPATVGGFAVCIELQG